MRRTVDLDVELETELAEVVTLTKEKSAVVIRQALRAGLPTVANRFQAPRPAGYFADDYGQDSDRVALETAMSKVRQRAERPPSIPASDRCLGSANRPSNPN
ncbi:MAG: hypothetical protein ABSA47_13670 [Verrucomicrobiota bacterium]|jgi:hypothetical protein